MILLRLQKYMPSGDSSQGNFNTLHLMASCGQNFTTDE